MNIPSTKAEPLTSEYALTPKFRSSADAVIAWVSEHARLPRQSGVIPEDELSAGRWVSRQRSLYAKWVRTHPGRSAERFDWLDEKLPGWRTANTRPAARKMRSTRTVEGTIKAIERFTLKYGRLPQIRGEMKGEAALGKFLDNQRQRHRLGIIRPSVLARLNRTVPGWHGPRKQVSIQGVGFVQVWRSAGRLEGSLAS